MSGQKGLSSVMAENREVSLKCQCQLEHDLEMQRNLNKSDTKEMISIEILTKIKAKMFIAAFAYKFSEA